MDDCNVQRLVWRKPTADRAGATLQRWFRICSHAISAIAFFSMATFMKNIKSTVTGLNRSKAKPLPIGWAQTDGFEVPIPRDEKQRLVALGAYAILDTPPEESFNGITQRAAHVCQTPMALMVLIDRDRQWFKAMVGVRVRETPRALSFCAHIRESQVKGRRSF